MTRPGCGVGQSLASGEVVTVHNYPYPTWPDVRAVVDEHSRRLGWRRAAQAGYLGEFQT